MKKLKMNLIKLKKRKNGRQRKIILWNELMYIYFQNFRKINTFGRDIYNSIITLKEADKDQTLQKK